MRFGNAAKNVSLMAASVVFSLFIAEVLFSVLGASTLQHDSSSYRRADEVFHHGFIPNSSGVFRSAEWDVSYSINSLGFRDIEYGAVKPQNTFRILMVGDSYTEGYGVESADSFPKQLESMLNNGSAGKKYEVISAGVGSYSPILEYLLLKYRGIQLNPDLVILNFDWSDPFDDYDYSRFAVRNNADVIAVKRQPQENKSLFANLRNFMSKRSYIYQFFAQKFAATTSPIVPGDREKDRLIFLRDNLTDSDYDALFGNSAPYLVKIKDMLKQQNISFVIHTYPYAVQVSTEAWKSGRQTFFFSGDTLSPAKPFSVVEEFGRENNITVISSYSHFKAAQSPEQLYFDYDGHFTPAGHRLAARALYEFIENSTKLDN